MQDKVQTKNKYLENSKYELKQGNKVNCMFFLFYYKFIITSVIVVIGPATILRPETLVRSAPIIRLGTVGLAVTLL